MLEKSKLLIIAAMALVPASFSSAQEGQRSLPKGEERPHFLEKVFESPVGEVEFTVLGSDGSQRSGFLRNSLGNLIPYLETKGGAVCEEWFASSKLAPPPSGCEFVFYDKYEDRSLTVRSEEMAETSLFQAAKGRLRGWRAYVAL